MKNRFTKNKMSLALLAIFSLLIIMPTTASAFVGLCCAKCGGNMPMNIIGAGVPETKEFRLKITPMIMNMDKLQDGTSGVNGDSLLGMPAMGKFMAVPTNMDMSMQNVAVGYSLSDDFFAGVMFMQKSNNMDMKFSSMMQTMTGKDSFVMESSGMADTMLMAKYRIYTDDALFPTSQASLFLGLSLPTGSINMKNDKHPLAMRQTEQLPYSMQLGSGTYDPTIGVVMSASSSPYWWGANFMYTTHLGKNSRDYAVGDVAKIDIYAMRQLHHNFLLHAQLNGRSWQKIRGEMDEAAAGTSGRSTKGDATSTYMTPLWDTANYGGSKINGSIGFQFQPFPLHILDVTASVPIYQSLNGPQLRENYRVSISYYIEFPTSKSRRRTGQHKGLEQMP